MYKMIVGLLLVLSTLGGRAQTFNEWFFQTKTQLKYYAEQIVALQSFAGKAQKGYQIVESGLGAIRDIKSGEFSLHNGFYSSLSAVNPAIGKMGEVAEIVALQVAIVERWSGALSRYRQDSRLSGNELDYIGKVCGVVLADGLADINALLDLMTADRLKMSDDQRMDRIRELDVGMEERYGFTTRFADQADLLSLQRQGEGVDLGTLRGIYGLP